MTSFLYIKYLIDQYSWCERWILNY